MRFPIRPPANSSMPGVFASITPLPATHSTFKRLSQKTSPLIFEDSANVRLRVKWLRRRGMTAKRCVGGASFQGVRAFEGVGGHLRKGALVGWMDVRGVTEAGGKSV